MLFSLLEVVLALFSQVSHVGNKPLGLFIELYSQLLLQIDEFSVVLHSGIVLSLQKMATGSGLLFNPLGEL